MKAGKPLLLFCSLFLGTWVSDYAQSSYCRNLNFELGNFTNWVGYTWRYSDRVPSINTSPVAGIVARRQTIMSDTTEYDANTGFALKKIPPGYLYSARLGDEIISSDGNPRCWEQSLRYSLTIDSSNALLILKFALVLQYASDHDATNEPRFRLTLYDSNGNKLNDCSNYDVFSSNKNIKGFKTYTPTGSQDPVEWRDWTTVGVDLLNYIGQTITVEFMSADCTQQYHYGYAYFVAECHPLYITVDYCTADTLAKLEAPEGFESYSWTDINGNVIDTLQTLVTDVGPQQVTYTCTMTSATGCVVSLQSTVVKYEPKADFNSFMLDCFSNRVQFANLSTTNTGSLSYLWNFGDGNSSYERNPAYSFSTSGMHTVSLILKNSPSTCADTLTKDVESFSPPLVGITGDSTYCPGLSTFLKAYGAYDYTWSNGSKADSIEIGAPGGIFWLLGRSSTGCVSDTIYRTVGEEPDWEFIANGDSIICEGNNISLSAWGAVSYLWNTGETNDTIITSTPGIYTVTGTNKRGCEKTLTFRETVYPVPAVDFSISPDALDTKHNVLTCIITPENGVQYEWDMGDSSNESGSRIMHEYAISNQILDYLVRLTATSSYGCTDSSFRYIDVVPFVPNVFTPNEDGINDLFMQGLDLKIVDRNGQLIYSGNTGWDGKYKGKPVDPDTYFYLISYKDSNNNTHYRKGYVTLVR